MSEEEIQRMIDLGNEFCANLHAFYQRATPEEIVRVINGWRGFVGTTSIPIITTSTPQ